MGTWGATWGRQPLDRLCLNTQTDSSDLTQSPRWQTASNPSRCERASSSETPSSAASKWSLTSSTPTVPRCPRPTRTKSTSLVSRLSSVVARQPVSPSCTIRLKPEEVRATLQIGPCWICVEDREAQQTTAQATEEQTEDSPRYGKGQGCVQEEGQIDDWSLLQGANGVREDGRRQNWCRGYWALCLSTHTIFANRLHRFFVHGFRWHEQYGRWHKFS